jgi:alkylhydroperoxidase/carboxymuconolactone decarboxylase family protein YurZ
MATDRTVDYPGTYETDDRMTLDARRTVMKEPGAEFETGLDWSQPNTITNEEAEGLRRWYVETHGEGNLDLTPFVPFVIEHFPGAFKRYRRHIQTISSTPDGIPQAVTVLLFLHYYTRIGNERGILYEIIAAREEGVTKQQVLDLLALTFVTSGPFSMNAVASGASEYLNRWNPAADEENPPGLWPSNWSPDARISKSVDLDHRTTSLADGEWQALIDQYRNATQTVPPYVQFFALHRPDLLKTTRHRYDGVMEACSLPIQLIPLLQLHTAAIAGRGQGAAEAAVVAHRVGVTKEQVIQTVAWAFLYADESTMNVVSEALHPIVSGWES